MLNEFCKMWLARWLILCSLLMNHGVASVFNCTGSLACEGETLSCSDTEDCIIYCEETAACRSVIINCPNNNEVNCYLFHYAPYSRDAIIYGNNANSLQVEVYADIGTGNKFFCQNNNFCTFTAYAYGFVESQFYCPRNGNCTIKCNFQSSYRHAEIYAQNSTNLNVISNSANCYQYVDVYCPLFTPKLWFILIYLLCSTVCRLFILNIYILVLSNWLCLKFIPK